MEITLPAELRNYIIWSTVFSIVMLVSSICIAYAVIRLAIAHGIKDSGLVDALRRQSIRQNSQPVEGIPDMRAD